MNFDIRHFLRSLRHNRGANDKPQAPNALMDCSAVVKPLSCITRNGRALHSDEEYGYAGFIGDLAHEYLGDDPTEADKDACIAGLMIFNVMVMRKTAEIAPDWRPEEFLIDIASQDAIRELGSEMANIPAQSVDGELVPDFAQLPMFHRPIPVSDAVLRGFISRRIAPFFPLQSEFPDLGDVEIVNNESSVRKVNLNDLGPLETDPLDDFDEFYSEFFDNEDGYLDDLDRDDEDPDAD